MCVKYIFKYIISLMWALVLNWHTTSDRDRVELIKECVALCYKGRSMSEARAREAAGEKLVRCRNVRAAAAKLQEQRRHRGTRDGFIRIELPLHWCSSGERHIRSVALRAILALIDSVYIRADQMRFHNSIRVARDCISISASICGYIIGE